MLVGSEKNDSAYRCSGFLIENDVVVTSGHCVPKDLRSKNSKCEGRLYLLLPKTNDVKEETLECSEILSFNQEKGSLYDYAFIKTKQRSKRTPLKVNQRNRINLESSTIWKSNPNAKYEGRIYKTECHLQQQAINSEFFDGPKTGIINYSGCVTRKGNSGSPVLNQAGQVIGIHQSSLKSTSNLGIVLKNYVRNRNFYPSGSATNFGCLCKKNNGYTHQCKSYPKSCNVQYTNLELDTRRNKLLNSAMLRYITLQERNWIKSQASAGATSPFDWKTTSSFRVIFDEVLKTPESLNIYIAATPKCIRSRFYVTEESIPLSISNYRYNRSLFVSMARLCKVKVKFTKNLQMESMKLIVKDCKMGRGYIDYMGELLSSSELPLVFSYAVESYQDIGIPFPQRLKLKYCQ